LHPTAKRIGAWNATEEPGTPTVKPVRLQPRVRPRAAYPGLRRESACWVASRGKLNSITFDGVSASLRLASRRESPASRNTEALNAKSLRVPKSGRLRVLANTGWAASLDSSSMSWLGISMCSRTVERYAGKHSGNSDFRAGMITGSRVRSLRQSTSRECPTLSTLAYQSPRTPVEGSASSAREIRRRFAKRWVLRKTIKIQLGSRGLTDRR
jgi:hypothetical protein